MNSSDSVLVQSLKDGIRVILRANLIDDAPLIACARCAAVLDTRRLEPSAANLLVTLCPYCGSQL